MYSSLDRQRQDFDSKCGQMYLRGTSFSNICRLNITWTRTDLCLNLTVAYKRNIHVFKNRNSRALITFIAHAWADCDVTWKTRPSFSPCLRERLVAFFVKDSAGRVALNARSRVHLASREQRRLTFAQKWSRPTWSNNLRCNTGAPFKLAHGDSVTRRN